MLNSRTTLPMFPEANARTVDGCTDEKCPVAKAVLKEFLESFSTKAFRQYRRYIALGKEEKAIWEKIQAIEPHDYGNLIIYEPEKAAAIEAATAPLRKRSVQVVRLRNKIVETAASEGWIDLLPD